MQYMKEIVTGVGTLAIAVGIGFVMQSSDTAKQRYGDQARTCAHRRAPKNLTRF